MVETFTMESLLTEEKVITKSPPPDKFGAGSTILPEGKGRYDGRGWLERVLGKRPEDSNKGSVPVAPQAGAGGSMDGGVHNPTAIGDENEGEEKPDGISIASEQDTIKIPVLDISGTPPAPPRTPDAPPKPDDDHDREPDGPKPPEWWKLGKTEWEHWSWLSEEDFNDNPLFQPIVTMLAIDGGLSPQERERRQGEFKTVAEEWERIASSEKFYKLGKKVADKEGELEKHDKGAIDGIKDEARKEELQDNLFQLDRLLSQEEDLYPRLHQDDGSVKEKPGLYTETDWKTETDNWHKLTDKSTGEIQKQKDKIVRMTSPGFMGTRDKIIDEIKASKLEEEELKKEKENNKKLEDQLRQLEGLIDGRLRRENIPNIPSEEEMLPKRSLKEVVAEFESQERLKEGGADYDEAVYKQSKGELERYFYVGRSLGLFRDIDGAIESDFREMAEKVMPAQVLTRDVVRNLSAYPREYAIDTESPEVLDSLIMGGISPTAINIFRGENQGEGLRGIYIRRAYRQMHQALSNLPKDVNLTVSEIEKQRMPLNAVNREEQLRNLDTDIRQLRGDIDRNSIKRVSHEWNGSLSEQRLARRYSEQRISRPEERMYDENAFEIKFAGTSLEDIRTGVNQFVYDVLYGTGAYDLDRIINRMNLLGIALGRMSEVIKAREGGTLEEVTQKLNEIRWPAENQVWMHIRNYLQVRLMAEEDAKAAHAWVKEDKRVAALITQEEGKGGLEMHEMLDPRSNLFFNPVGFKGQFMNDKVSQYALRETIKELHIQKLMKYEFAGGDLQTLTTCKSFDEFRLKFKKRDSDVVGDLRKAENAAKDTLNTAVTGVFEPDSDPDKEGQIRVKETVSIDQLIEVRDQLRRNRENLTLVRAVHNDVRQKAKSAFEFAVKTYDVLGISAELGDTTEVMANGDHINTEHFNMAIKHAIIEAGKSQEFKKKYGCEDNLALMRKRGVRWVEEKGINDVVNRMWTEELNEVELLRLEREGSGSERTWAIHMLKWIREVQKEANDKNDKNERWPDYINLAKKGLEGISSIRVLVNKKNKEGKFVRENTLFSLQEGFEDSGITPEQWEAAVEAYRQCQMYGFNATIAGKSLSEISKDEKLRNVSNTFLFAYAGTRDNVNNATLVKEAMKGNKPSLQQLREKLALTGREEFTGSHNVESEDEQEVLNIYTDAISDNISFDVDVRKIGNFLSTREKVVAKDGNRIVDVSIKKVNPNGNNSTIRNTEFTNKYGDFGFPGQSWLSKRLRKFKRFYDKNERSTEGRFVELNNYFAISNHGSVPRETGSPTIFNMIWDRDMDKFDEYTLTTEPDRGLDLWAFHQAYTGVFDMQRGGKDFGFSDKPLSDGDMLAVIGSGPQHWNIPQEMAHLMTGNRSTNLPPATLNQYVENLIERDKKYIPIVTAIVKRFEVDSGAAGAGLGYEQAEKLNYRHMKMLLSKGKPGARLEGGLVVYSNVAPYLAWTTLPNSFDEGTRLIERKWQKPRPGRNPRISSGAVSAKVA